MTKKTPTDAPNDRVNPELLRQLRDASPTQSPVQAVFLLKDPSESSYLGPQETRDTVARLVEAAEKKSGESVLHVNVFSNLGSFVVEASPRLVEELLEADEIRFASPNRR